MSSTLRYEFESHVKYFVVSYEICFGGKIVKVTINNIVQHQCRRLIEQYVASALYEFTNRRWKVRFDVLETSLGLFDQKGPLRTTLDLLETFDGFGLNKNNVLVANWRFSMSDDAKRLIRLWIEKFTSGTRRFARNVGLLLVKGHGLQMLLFIAVHLSLQPLNSETA